MEKTNVMRILDKLNISYKSYSYDRAETNGEKVAILLKEDPNKVFKTLVTVSNNNEHYVFMIPVSFELDLKKASLSAGVKSIEMIKQKDLLPLTGYIHGGCSPIGMKKVFPLFIDESVELNDTIFFSAGKVGYQVEVNVEDFFKITKAKTCDLTK